jgi:ArsR family transcriptional regulator, arsenate/arsenite/antimonite-responsive transcriptional repressor
MRPDVTIAGSLPPDLPPVDLPPAELALRALADPMRAAIVERLASEQLCNCHLQEALGAKQTLVSHHLRLLREAGLVLTEPCGRFTYYRLAPGAFDAARDALADLADAAGSQVPKRPC